MGLAIAADTYTEAVHRKILRQTLLDAAREMMKPCWNRYTSCGRVQSSFEKAEYKYKFRLDAQWELQNYQDFFGFDDDNIADWSIDGEKNWTYLSNRDHRRLKLRRERRVLAILFYRETL